MHILEIMKLVDLSELRSSARDCPIGPSIYFLFLRGDLVYIGCTTNAVGRIGSHASGLKRKDFDSFAVIPVPAGIAPISLERAYIFKYRPKLNPPPDRDQGLDENGLTSLDRAMMRVEAGETLVQAAQAESTNIGVLRARHARTKNQDEKNEFLLSYINVGQTQESIRANRDANLRIYSKVDRGCPEEDWPLKD